MIAKDPSTHETFFNVVNGELRGSQTETQGIDPCTKTPLWPVPVASPEDVEDAVKAANRAFSPWSRTPFEERVDRVKRFRSIYESSVDYFIELLMRETGKPRETAAGEAHNALDHFDHNIKLTLPEEVLQEPDRTITTRHVPIGVAVAICPWNFPIVLSISKILPAVLAGCCIIVKSSEYTPYTALKIAEIAQQAFPPGVVQALGGDGKVGASLVVHPQVHKISFTGSIATGKRIVASSAATLKRVTLELGGNDAAIILPDVNISEVASQVVFGSFWNTGQVCVAIKRVYVHEDIYEEFLAAMAQAAAKMTVGDPTSKDTVLGPIQNSMQYERLKGFYEDSVAKGHKFAYGSGPAKEGKGYFLQPTIIDNPPESSRIVTEEQFGPIVPTLKWKDEEEVITRANDSSMGLAACVWAADTAAAERIGRQLQAGSVFINSFEQTTPKALFSGQKQSGLGGEWGSTGLLSYCNAQVCHVFK